MTDALLWQAVVATLAFFCAGIVKGTLGVGLPLVAIPIAAIAMPPAQAMALTIAPILVSNSWQVIETGVAGEALRRFWRLIIGLCFGILLGGLLLSKIELKTSLILLGIVLLGFCALQLLPTRWQIQQKDERWLGPLAGFVSGFIGGFTGLYGLIALSYLIALRLDKNMFVGSISLLYLIGILALTITLTSHQVIAMDELIGTFLVLLPLFIGMLIGRRIRDRISQALFRRLLLLLLMVIGSSLILRGIN
jgi:uncharacterized membrane protein YfcA